MINAGKLNKRISILRAVGVTNNSLGQGTPKYQVYKTVWANVTPLTGKEYSEAQIIRAETTYRIKLRYIDGVLPDMKVEYNGKKFDIISVLNIEERNVELHLMCAEQYPTKGV